MAEQASTTEKKSKPARKSGKSYKKQKHYPIKTTEEVVEEKKVQEPFNKPNAVVIEVWFSSRGHTNYILQQAMRAYTKVKRATLDDWDQIFAKF